MYFYYFYILKDENYGSQIECAYFESNFLNLYWPNINQNHSLIDYDHCIDSCNIMGMDQAVLDT